MATMAKRVRKFLGAVFKTSRDIACHRIVFDGITQIVIVFLGLGRHVPCKVGASSC
jgi:hypothetical protein